MAFPGGLRGVGDSDAAGADVGGDFDVFGPVYCEDVGAIGFRGGRSQLGSLVGRWT